MPVVVSHTNPKEIRLITVKRLVGIFFTTNVARIVSMQVSNIAHGVQASRFPRCFGELSSIITMDLPTMDWAPDRGKLVSV